MRYVRTFLASIELDPSVQLWIFVTYSPADVTGTAQPSFLGALGRAHRLEV